MWWLGLIEVLFGTGTDVRLPASGARMAVKTLVNNDAHGKLQVLGVAFWLGVVLAPG